MQHPVSAPSGVTAPNHADRIGFAQLTRRAFEGGDLHPLRERLLARIEEGTAEAGEGLDLSLIAQLLGEKEAGLVIQTEVLSFHQLFRTPCAAAKPRLRVLALAADIDMGGNTPIDFLLEDSDIELLTLYVVKGIGLPENLPEHDVAIVIASDSEECREALALIEKAAPRWPRPLLNRPDLIGNLDRDKLYRLLAGVPGLDIPVTTPATRAQLSELSQGKIVCEEIAGELRFPMIARPRGTHAGVGSREARRCGGARGLSRRAAGAGLFVARFVDYASPDGLYRKYRLAMVDGKPYACHMAIADRWDIWYLNAFMAFSEEKRAEEAVFHARLRP